VKEHLNTSSKGILAIKLVVIITLASSLITLASLLAVAGAAKGVVVTVVELVTCTSVGSFQYQRWAFVPSSRR